MWRLLTLSTGGIKKFKEEGVKDMIAEKLILETDRLIYESEIREEKREEKAKLEIAKNLFDMGMTVEQIKMATKLPMSKITWLQTQK